MIYRCFTRGNVKPSHYFIAKSRCQETSGDSRTFHFPSQEIVWQTKGQIVFFTLYCFLVGLTKERLILVVAGLLPFNKA